VTEAAVLLGRDPDKKPASADEALDWARELAARCEAAVVMTGFAPAGGELGAVVCAGDDVALLRHKRAGGYYPGTGDLFSAVLLGGLLHGDAVSDAAARAAGFVRDAASLTEKSGLEPLHGVLFEPLLGRLAVKPRGASRHADALCLTRPDG
jgi:pyridoxine kinase